MTGRAWIETTQSQYSSFLLHFTAGAPLCLCMQITETLQGNDSRDSGWLDSGCNRCRKMMFSVLIFLSDARRVADETSVSFTVLGSSISRPPSYTQILLTSFSLKQAEIPHALKKTRKQKKHSRLWLKQQLLCLITSRKRRSLFAWRLY